MIYWQPNRFDIETGWNADELQHSEVLISLMEDQRVGGKLTGVKKYEAIKEAAVLGNQRKLKINPRASKLVSRL